MIALELFIGQVVIPKLFSESFIPIFDYHVHIIVILISGANILNKYWPIERFFLSPVTTRYNLFVHLAFIFYPFTYM